VSSSHAGRPVSDAHPDLAGSAVHNFVSEIEVDSDVVFLCAGHGKSAEWLASQSIPDTTLIIDLSADHRLDPTWVYGLPEVHRDRIVASKRIANPGCFATTIELALLPLAEQGLLSAPVIVNATTGSTGAGQAPSDTTHYSWRANNLSVYKAFTHQHLAEIAMVLGIEPVFVPLRGAFPRGILAAAVVHMQQPIADVSLMYQQRYAGHPFVHIANDLPDVKRAVGTNMCFIGMEQHGDQLLIVSVLDNLIKGASGQAIQNMNLAMGWNESAGLDLVAIGY
jgi:N-acetyl-gamma-glutamyl-phosphate reductase